MSSSPGHEKAAGGQISGCLGGQPLAQALHGASLQARHLHLRDMQDAGGALLVADDVGNMIWRVSSKAGAPIAGAPAPVAKK